MLGLGLKQERSTPTNIELVKRTGGVLYLDARKVNGLTVGNNSPLTTTFKDLSNNNDDLTLNSFAGTINDGYDGNILVFDGVNSYLSIDNSTALNITGTGNFGISMIIQIQSGATSGYVCCKNDTGFENVRYGVSYSSSKINVVANGVVILTSSNEITTDIWHRISVFRIDGVVYLYIDGVNRGQIANTNSLISANKFRVGCRVDGESNSLFLKMKLGVLIISNGTKLTLASGQKMMNKISKGYL